MDKKNTNDGNINISTIAKLANTSVMTVSRVLNNKPDVSKKTRQKVLDVIKEYNYKPHALARKLSGGKTGIIGIALYTQGQPLSGFYVEVLQGVQMELAKNGHDVLLLAPSPNDEYGRRVVQTNLLDGIVLMGPHTSSHDVFNLREEKFPFITIGRRVFDDYTAPFVAPNYERAFREVVGYAAEKEVTSISVIIGGLNIDDTSCFVQDRIRGIKNGMALYGEGRQLSLVSGVSSFEDGYEHFSKLETLPELLVLDSSEYSFGAVMALRDRGITTDGSLQFAGINYENAFMQRYEDVLGISIPQWRISWTELGALAAQDLLSRVTDEEAESINARYCDFYQQT
ncbi:LacI family DNA-binding transcriptional regulator [Alicyclobacillus fodiniaquatilis]|uniref:LacI family DNA-binding transcriptional regulator n=1 Tax=Alicyclobacillus fodiniaquatilis TaxID=1661150 RepID=A0ABW4JGK3_9BACL